MRRRTPKKNKPRSAGTLLASWLSEEAAAAALGLTEKTLIAYRKGGVGPAFSLIGRGIFYSHASLEAWLAAGGKQKSA